MATFLVERYWPGVTAAAAGLETSRLRDVGASILETIVADRDEVCYWYIEAGSSAEVSATFALADVAVDRIGPARRIATDD